MFKKTLALISFIALAACGPAPQPPAETAATAPTTSEVTAQPQQEAPAQPAAQAEPAPAPRPAKVATRPKPQPTPVATAEPVAAPAPVCTECGVIAGVQEDHVKGDASAVGTLGGAAAGGLAGAQFGKKSGKILATIGGAVLGGLAGREVESRVKTKVVYRVTVNMDDGSQRVVTMNALDGLAVGSKVKVVNGALQYNG
ncbi:MAG: glycine zipper 2TM domain-containing protein [Nevskia sp.]|jgi:outer membrane lipoprotein SlyB|nr:glycine zipper 2TM domain-containing protein [Nevskia sp.]MCK9386404.1 glycine zipper 2TM domain-containing protein [Nevskia sp.]